MTKAWRFDNGLKRFQARLMFALGITLFAVVAQAQQPSTRDNTQQSTAAKAAQITQRLSELLG